MPFWEAPYTFTESGEQNIICIALEKKFAYALYAGTEIMLVFEKRNLKLDVYQVEIK